jgi:hypothetical protein
MGVHAAIAIITTIAAKIALCRFMVGNYSIGAAIPLTTKKRADILVATVNTPLLPIPTISLVREEGNEFDRENKLIEGTLGLLRAQFPHNTETSHVFLKVLVLNRLYSTRVNDIDVEPLAHHIAGLGIDPLLDQEALEAVDLITNCPDLKKYLSFASKFCSWHKPTVYPIWDGNVRACLWAYKKQHQFAPFHNYDLWVYESYRAIIIAFRAHYDLDSLTFKELDKFLYRSGGRILRRKD